MKFVLNRHHTLQTTLGHSIGFTKGEPVHVPSELWAAAQAIGAVPEDELPEAKIADTKEPADSVERKAAIFAAFEALVLAGKRDAFTGTGVPHAKSLASQLGFILDNKERDILWQEFNLAKAGD